MIRACVIGVSGYGAVHYDLLLAAQAAGQVEIVGAAIINQAEEPEKCARLQALGCRIFDNYRDMLEQLAGKQHILAMASRQTQVVSMIHAGPPIQTLDGETVLLANGVSRTFIPGIEDTLRTAFDSDSSVTI